jgi:MoaA/NifB/PqqE/SkfB family radical SAM enzyme
MSDKINFSWDKNTIPDRKESFPDRVFFTWDIHYLCNYKCSYCFFANKWDIMAKENIYLGIDELSRVWEGIYYRYGPCHIHISGGEPSIYPGFIDLISSLSNYHSIEIDTNLSFDADLFMDKENPEKIRFTPAFHPQFADLASFLRKVDVLKKNGYDLEGVNYVAFPLQLKDMKEYKKRFVDIGMGFVIQPFRGVFDNRDYPHGYLPEEIDILRECGFHDISTSMLNWYGQEKEPERNGKHCKMGHVYAKIHSNGDAYRCCMILEEGKIGNLFEGTFKLYDEPRICEYPTCHCFRAMIVGKESEWCNLWVGLHKK